MYPTSERGPEKRGDGSISVYQALPKNRKPGKVQVFRSQYIRIDGPDGKAYGRTQNIYLLAVESGSEQLSSDDETKLREQGLTENDIAYVNRRLLELCGPAREHAAANTMSKVEHHINSAVTLALGASHPDVGTYVLTKLQEARLKLDDKGVFPAQKNDAPSDSGSAYDRLAQALREISSGCASAQTAYRQLPKGKDAPDEVILALQKTWFDYPDMLTVLKARACFYRPSGWTTLRDAVYAGKVYKRGDEVKMQ